MKQKNKVWVILVLFISNSFITTSHAEEKVRRADVQLEMKVMAEKYSDMQGIQKEIGLSSQLQQTKEDLAATETELANPQLTSDYLEKKNQLNTKKQADIVLIQALTERTTGFPSLQSLTQQLQVKEQEYNLRKSWLQDPERNQVEKQEIELRIATVNEQEKELNDAKQFFEAGKCDAAIVEGGIGGAAALAVPLSMSLWKWGRYPLGEYTGGITILSLVAGYVGLRFEADYCQWKWEDKIDELFRQLEDSKKKLQTMLDAYNQANQ